MGRLAGEGSLLVETVTLDRLVSEGIANGPQVVKIDVEGGEADVLRGAEEALAQFHPIIFLATHGQQVHQECCRLLVSHGYRLESLDGRPVPETDEIVAHFPSNGHRAQKQPG